MFVTATTVKDTLPNVQRFVGRNLGGGVDHLVVFLDAEQPECEAWLDEHPHVTCVATHRDWWAKRPDQLNVRQRIHANVVRSLVAALDPDGWTCHVDADEVVRVDRVRLDALGADVPVVHLSTLEAVSRRRWEGEVTHFKRPLESEDLTLLTTLGVLERPENAAYFRGHFGKSAMRPGLDRWHSLHHVVDADRSQLPAEEPPWARVLHYESFSGEEFVRKWTTMLAAGPMASFRPQREPTAIALRALIGKDLTEEQAARYLMRIYERTTEDDFETLRDLGLLEEVDPDVPGHTPEPLGAERRGALDTMLGVLREENKRLFHPGNPAGPVAEVMARAAGAAGIAPPAAPAEPAADGAEKPDRGVRGAVRERLSRRR